MSIFILGLQKATEEWLHSHGYFKLEELLNEDCSVIMDLPNAPTNGIGDINIKVQRAMRDGLIITREVKVTACH